MALSKEAIYSNKKLNPGTIWVLFLFLGWSYGSMDQMGKQILFYITFGGLGIWSLVRLFTLSGAIKEYNKKVAMEAGFDNKELVQLGLV